MNAYALTTGSVLLQFLPVILLIFAILIPPTAPAYRSIPIRQASYNPLPRKGAYALEDAQHFLETLESAPTKYQAFFVLAIYGGFRRGELLGLEWQDIDFKEPYDAEYLHPHLCGSTGPGRL